jgi:hypothetical protein
LELETASVKESVSGSESAKELGSASASGSGLAMESATVSGWGSELVWELEKVLATELVLVLAMVTALREWDSSPLLPAAGEVSRSRADARSDT